MNMILPLRVEGNYFPRREFEGQRPSKRGEKYENF